MSTITTKEEQSSPFWHYVAIDDYKLPASPVTHTVKRGISSLQALLHRQKDAQAPLFQAPENLQTLPAWQLERLAPPPQWHEAAEALQTVLETWLDQETPEQPVVALIGPPSGGYGEILASWADAQKWLLLDPPTPEQIMANDDTWASTQLSAQDSWVLAGLEKLYFRHATGLDLVRRFLDRAYSGELGRGIIGCSSWAWAFLQHVWHGRRSNTLTLQAFGQDQLTEYFQSMVNSANTKHLNFRQADNGNYVLPPLDNEESPEEISSFMQLLAAHSRGILGTASDIWRLSLQAEPDEMLAKDTETEAQNISQQTIWVTPWEQIKHPSLPDGAGQNEAFVLHALLLHSGLPFDLLPQLLPLSPSQTMDTLFQLKDANLVAVENDYLQITSLSYPIVRRFLNDQGYLIDGF